MNPEADAQNALIKNLRRSADDIAPYDDQSQSPMKSVLGKAVIDLRQAANSIEDLAKLRWEVEYMFRERIQRDITKMLNEMVERETAGYQPRLTITTSDDDAGQPTWYFEVVADTSSFAVELAVKIRRGQ